MKLRLECVSIQHNARIRHGDRGEIPDERVTVVLVPTHPGGDPGHPNWIVWATRTAFGELRLADIPLAQSTAFKLHTRYTVDVTEEA